jgi:hypothetical protein
MAENLKREGGTPTSRGQWGRRALIAGHVALSFVLPVPAQLLTGSLRNLRHIDLGFGSSSTLRLREGMKELDGDEDEPEGERPYHSSRKAGYTSP